MFQPNITLFTKPGCPYCDRAKAVLNQLGLTYEERNVQASERNAKCRRLAAAGGDSAAR
ncbi:MAG: glutaredoxin [Cyanobacteria bacterium P01_A01_bin.123]